LKELKIDMSWLKSIWGLMLRIQTLESPARRGRVTHNGHRQKPGAKLKDDGPKMGLRLGYGLRPVVTIIIMVELVV